MDKRYNLTLLADGKYMCTDLQTTLVCTFKKGEFNDTQTMEFETQPKDLMTVPRICNEMGQWLLLNHMDILAPMDEQVALMRMVIGKALRQAREMQGMTYKQVSEICDLAPYNLKRIEDAKYNYTIDNLIRFASAVGLKLFDLGD